MCTQRLWGNEGGGSGATIVRGSLSNRFFSFFLLFLLPLPFCCSSFPFNRIVNPIVRQGLRAKHGIFFSFLYISRINIYNIYIYVCIYIMYMYIIIIIIIHVTPELNATSYKFQGTGSIYKVSLFFFVVYLFSYYHIRYLINCFF